MTDDFAGAAARPDAVLPDEDFLVPPAEWSRVVMPRRGGIPGSAVAAAASSVAAADTLIASARKNVAGVLKDEECEPELVAAAQEYLAGGLTAASPLGTAVVAAAVHRWSVKRPEKYETFADAWVAARGVVFAAQVVAEWSGLVVGRNRAGKVSRCIRRETAGDSRRHHWDESVSWCAHAQRVRAHLASASDDDYAQARAAMAVYRNGSQRQRCATAFLLPTETAWVDEDCRELAAGPRFREVAELLWCAAGSREHLQAATLHLDMWELVTHLDKLVTAADGARQDLVPLLTEWFDGGDLDAELRRRVLSLLAVLPHDDAFRALLQRLDQTFVQPAVTEAAKRYPVRAVRLLVASSSRTSAKVWTARDLLRAHVRSNPAAVAAALPVLSAQERERVAAVTDEAATVPYATPDALPVVLVAPPWTAPNRKTGTVCIQWLRRPAAGAMAWRPGERDEWYGSRSPFAFHSSPSGGAWENTVRLHRANPEHHHGIALFSEGPEELARPLLADWRPANYWAGDVWMQRVIARFELDALPAALHLARSQPAAGAVLLPYAVPEVADLMAEWLGRLKSARAIALAWLARHAAAAAQALIPAAIGKPGPARRRAEPALRAIASAGHEAEVREAAQRYGGAEAYVVGKLLAADPLEILPPKLPKLPDWLDPAVLPQVLLRDRGGALPRESVRHVCTMLAMSKPGEVYAGVDVVKQACDPASLAEFGWAMFQSWQAVGFPPKDGWVLPALGWLGDDETVRRLAPVIRAWPGEGGHARAVAGLDVLTAIGTDVALLHLHGIAQKVKYRGVKDRAGEKVAEVAADLGLTADELADRLVPDLGLDASGSLVLDYGPRQFTVGFDEHLKPYVADADGTRRRALPKPGARDDQELAPAAYQRFTALKKDVRTIAADQITRLEQAMVNQRRWRAADFRRLFVAHPLLWHIVRRLVWATFDSGGDVRTTFRVAEDRTFADVDDDAVDLDDDTVVGVPHPVHLGDAVQAWGELFADYEILQPFPQLGREVHALTDAERAAETLERFRGVKVPTTTLIGLQRRGWERGDPQDAGIQGWLERDVPHGRTVVVHIDPGIPVGAIDHWPEQQLAEISIHPTSTGIRDAPGTTAFGALDPVTTSELLRDLIEVTS